MYLLFGDLNIDVSTNNSLHTQLCSITDQFSLAIIPTGHTRVTDSSESTIDIALTTNPICTNNCFTVSPLGISDHFGLFASINLLGPRPKSINPRKIWRYDHGNFSLAKDLLCELDSDSIVVEGDPNATWINWRNSFLEIMHTCIPRSILPKRKNLQLMSTYFANSKSFPSYVNRYKEL